MAYLTSEKYKKQIYAESSYSDLRIYINDTLIDSDYVMDVKFDDSCFEDEYFTLGSAIIQNIVLKLDNVCLPCPINEIENFRLVYGLELDDGTMEWIPIGEYELGKEPDTAYSDYTTFTLYDYMNKFDIEYDGSHLVPCTREQLVEDMCRKVGIELATPLFLGHDRMVNSFDNTIKAKQYLSFISERAGGFAKVGRDKRLYIKSYADVDVIELTEEQSASAVINSFDEIKVITKVLYEDALNKWEFGSDDGLVVRLSQLNPFSITEDEVREIYNKLNGLTFQSLDVKMWGDPAIDTGDIISVYGYRTFVQKSWQYNNGFFGSYKANLKDSGTISNVEKISADVQLRKVKSTLNEITGEIDIITADIRGNESNIAEIRADLTNINMKVEDTSQNLENNYLDKNQIDAISSTNNENIELLRQAVEESISSTQVQINVINEKVENGSTKIRTNTGFTFDDDGMKIAKEGEEMSSLVDNTGLYVKRDEDNVLVANNDGVETENLKVRTYFTIGTNSRLEDYKEVRTAIFYIGGVR